MNCLSIAQNNNVAPADRQGKDRAILLRPVVEPTQTASDPGQCHCLISLTSCRGLLMVSGEHFQTGGPSVGLGAFEDDADRFVIYER